MSEITLLLYALVAIGIYGVSALCFLVGFMFGRFARIKPRQKEMPPKPKIDSEAVRRAKRTQKELVNMLTYTGDPQEEIIDD